MIKKILFFIFVFCFFINSFVFAGATIDGGNKKFIVGKIKLLEVYEKTPKSNKIENPRQKSKKRLFVDTESDAKPHVYLKTEIQPDISEFRNHLFWMIKHSNSELKVGDFSSGNEIEIDFPTVGNRLDYKILLGIDENNNGKVDDSEDVNLNDYYITGLTVTDYNGSFNYCDNYAISAQHLPAARTLLNIFLNQTNSLAYPASSSTTINVNAFSLTELTHKVGSDFSQSGDGQIKEYTWDKNTNFADKIVNSDEIENEINAILTSTKQQVLNHFANSTTDFTANWSASVSPYFSSTQYILDWDEADLHYSLAHCDMVISINVVIKKNFFGTIVIDRLEASGTVTDLYDFNYEDGSDLSLNAATLQVGWYPSLGRNAGKIFRVIVNFNEVFSSGKFSY